MCTHVYAPCPPRPSPPREGESFARSFENLYDWIGRTFIRKTRNNRRLFPLLGERIKGEGGRNTYSNEKRRRHGRHAALRRVHLWLKFCQMDSARTQNDDRLTPSQRQAVAARGNMLVMAGAGTGQNAHANRPLPALPV